MMTMRHLTEFTPEVSELFSASFSEAEKVPEENILRTIGRGGNLVAFYDGDEFVGMSFFFTEEDRTFWVYFATCPEKRSKGYGAEIIRMLVERCFAGKRAFLVLEPLDPDAEDIDIRIRRHNYYLRNGFRDTGFQVISDDELFDTMFIQGTMSEKEIVDTVISYEDIHNGRK